MVLDDHDDQVIATIERLLDEGKTWLEIGLALGVDADTAAWYWDKELLRRRRCRNDE